MNVFFESYGFKKIYDQLTNLLRCYKALDGTVYKNCRQGDE